MVPRKQLEWWVRSSLGKKGPFRSWDDAMDYIIQTFWPLALRDDRWTEQPLIECSNGQTEQAPCAIDMMTTKELRELPSPDPIVRTERDRIADRMEAIEAAIGALEAENSRALSFERMRDPIARDYYERRIRQATIAFLRASPGGSNLAAELEAQWFPPVKG